MGYEVRREWIRETLYSYSGGEMDASWTLQALRLAIDTEVQQRNYSSPNPIPLPSTISGSTLNARAATASALAVRVCIRLAGLSLVT